MTVSIPELKKNCEMLLQAISQLENERQEPCPLEEGKEVELFLSTENYKKFIGNSSGMTVFLKVEGSDTIMRTNWFIDTSALKMARELVQACGGSSD